MTLSANNEKDFDSPFAETCERCGAPFFARLETEDEFIDVCKECRNSILGDIFPPGHPAITNESEAGRDADCPPPPFFASKPHSLHNKEIQLQKRVAKARLKRKQIRRNKRNK